jgi:hypothetical protein
MSLHEPASFDDLGSDPAYLRALEGDTTFGPPSALNGHKPQELDRTRRPVLLLDDDRSEELDAFLATDEPEHDWLIPGLLERGERVIVTAAEGSGKSTLLRQIGVQVASGLHPFTLEDIAPMSALLVDVENSRRHVRRQLRDVRDTADDRYQPGRFRVEIRPDGLDLTVDEDMAWLEQRCKVNATDLLLIGPVYKLGSGDPTREETARAIASALDGIRDVTGVAMIIEAHVPYADGSRSNKRPERPYGASLWSRWPEFGIFLAEDGALRHWRGQRDERAWPGKLMRGEMWPWMVADTSAAPAEAWHGPTHCMAAIVELLERTGEELSAPKIADRFSAMGQGFRRQTISDAAEILAANDRISARTGPRKARLFSAKKDTQEPFDESF